eukprot:SAG22_NODE_15473_length_348_cov_0.738956_2_plen_56_part_01
MLICGSSTTKYALRSAESASAKFEGEREGLVAKQLEAAKAAEARLSEQSMLNATMQ